MVYLDSQILLNVMQQVLRERHVDETSIHHVTHSLVSTSLRGTDSHGINLFPHYCRAIASERINRSPQFSVEQSSKGAMVLDADHSFGHHSGSEAIRLAVETAKAQGISAVSVANSTHFGAAAYFALQAAKENCIGFSFTNADALVKAHNSQHAFFGTNPICFAAPMANEEPFCLDMATSQVSWNRIKNARRNDEIIPSGWAYDGSGQIVTNPNDARSLEPSGNYKGFGLGMMVDILCALLSNNPISKDILPMYDSPIEARRQVSHFFMVLNIESFVDVDVFKSRLQHMCDSIRSMPTLNDDTPVMVAGDPEKKSTVKRLVSGIPTDDIIFSEYLEISEQFETAILKP